jgi:hypothetical protein
MVAISDERKKELRVWVYKVWNFHWKELAPKSNSRAQLLKYVLRDGFNNEELNRIELSIKAQTTHWRKQNKIERVIGIPTLSVWYNQQRYDDEFIDESAMEMSEREQLKECSVDGCSNDIHGSMFSFCVDHVPNTKKEMLKQAWVRTGLDMKSKTFIDDCKSHIKERMKIMVGKVT